MERYPARLATMEDPALQRGGYRPDIDGLRAVAVVSVIAFHAGLSLFPGGFVGVDVFFVISGYLITSLIYKQILTGKFSVTEFYGRRAKRILPALFAVLVLTTAVAVFLLSPAELKDFGDSGLATVLSGSNLYFWLTFGYFAQSANLHPLLMTWSLGIEEQFYVFFPPLMLLITRFRRGNMIAVLLVGLLLSLAAAALIVVSHPTAAFYLLPTRAWELASGGILAVLEWDGAWTVRYNDRRLVNALGLFGLGLVLFPVFAYSNATRFPGLSAGLPVLGTVLLIMARQSLINRYLLSFPPLVWVGLISYSWYLWHWPLLSVARLIADRPLRPEVVAGIVLLSLILAIGSYGFVEQPLRRSKTPAYLLLLRYAACSGVLLSAMLVLHLTNGLAQRSPELRALEAKGDALKIDPCLAEYGKSAPNLSSRCVSLDPNLPAVALLGDSHAAALAGALRAKAASAGLAFDQLTKTSCPSLLAVSRTVAGHPAHDRECARFNETALDFVKRPAIKVVILAGFWSAPFGHEEREEYYVRLERAGQRLSLADSARNFSVGLGSLVESLRSLGKNVVIMQDNPMFAFDPVRHFRLRSIRLRLFLAGILEPGLDAGTRAARRQDSVTAADSEAASIIDEMARRVPGVTTYDPKKLLCDATSCFFDDRNSYFYIDPQHLSFAGASYALRDFDLKRIKLD